MQLLVEVCVGRRFGGLVGAMLGGGIGAAVASVREGKDQDDGKNNEDRKERA